MIAKERLCFLNSRESAAGDYVLYWMQAAQRAEANPALQYAVQLANEKRRPCLAFFGLTGGFPEANARHMAFMLEGLRETQRTLADRGIKLVVRPVSPEKGVVEMARAASLVVTDRGYLRIQKSWRARAAADLSCSLIQVETEAVVPVETASIKEEYAAATLRPKLRKILASYLSVPPERKPLRDSLGWQGDSFDLENIDDILAGLKIDRSVGPSPFYRGGTDEAKKRFRVFLRERIGHFSDLRNNPSLDYLSHLSPYLHFGQISPVWLAMKAEATGSPGREAFLEELIVRRELAMNFVHYNDRYDSLESLPAWARATLAEHAVDIRPVLCTRAELEAGKTHDPYWNAAQREMALTGKMHGYMRMYWGKKILEWSASPEEAFATALYLNNKYEIDGRDPNGFAGVAWCFGKHDRPWGKRPIFGSVRYMNDRGLRRKFDADQYVRNVARLEARAD
ncbi:MAG: deoxyribodipyrimidine photo-lyase [Candidatus Aminicenantes bacterium]|nr:deoxyribodipyrimidine photo-lyase [Candidatus Aminicenantes bacterium]